MKKIILTALLLILVSVFMVHWFVSIAKCEILTLKHGDEFVGLESQTNMLNPGDPLKVLAYSKKSAMVYYRDKNGGDVLKFSKENNVWTLNRWYTIWSSSGSAEGFIWPYIR